jgi:hypothetical protein
VAACSQFKLFGGLKRVIALLLRRARLTHVTEENARKQSSRRVPLAVLRLHPSVDGAADKSALAPN